MYVYDMLILIVKLEKIKCEENNKENTFPLLYFVDHWVHVVQILIVQGSPVFLKKETL